MVGGRKGKMPVKMEIDSHGDASGSVQTQNHELGSNALAREGSLYSVTLADFQNQLGSLGIPLVNINIGDLLQIVRTAEIRRGIRGVGYEPSLLHNPGASAFSLLGDSSYILSRDLSNKRVYEVWQDVEQRQKSSKLDTESPEGQATLGEMTLGDFLVKAGAIVKTAPGNNDSGLVPLPPQQADNQISSNHQQQPHPPPQQPPMNVAYPESETVVAPATLTGTLLHAQSAGGNREISGDVVATSSEKSMLRKIRNKESAARWRARKQADHQTSSNHQQQPHPPPQQPPMNVAYPESKTVVAPATLTGTLLGAQTVGGNREISGDVVATSSDKSMLRKIRNRESAARSRARKQAYIGELENKVSRLQEANKRLKRRQDIQPRQAPEGKVTLGEMTLEDFLVKAGAIVKTAPGNNDSGLVPLPPQQADNQISSNHQQQPPMNVAYVESETVPAPATLTGTLLDAQTAGGNREISGDVVATSSEKSILRKIRNRESAARSRARKQAYIVELEKKVSRLNEANERLNSQEAADVGESAAKSNS